MRWMLSTAIALLLFAAALAGCGGGDDGDSTGSIRPGGEQASKEAAEEPNGTADRPAAAGQGAGSGGPDETTAAEPAGPAQRRAGKTASGRPAGKHVSLATNPKAIPGAEVTPTGAVQTLPPSEAGQSEAMKNSYASIRTFGSEAEGREATDITFALVQYLNARASGDWATACARLYSLLRDGVEKQAAESGAPSPTGDGCPAAYGSLMERASRPASAEAAKVDVASVRRGEGNRAFVIYKTPDTVSADMPMYLEDGVWKVGAIEAYVLTPADLAE